MTVTGCGRHPGDRDAASVPAQPPKIDLNDVGNLIGWKTSSQRGLIRELVIPGKEFLVIDVEADGRPVTNIAWTPADPGLACLAAYRGRSAALEGAIVRRYCEGNAPGSLLHDILYEPENQLSSPIVTAETHVRSTLKSHHSPYDSLGDFFYEYNRVLALDSAAGGRYYLPEDSLSAPSAALVTRHFAVVVSSQSPHPAQTFLVQPGMGISITANLTKKPGSATILVRPIKLRMSEIVDSQSASLMYVAMSVPLRTVAQATEIALDFLTRITGNAGVAILLFALVVRVVFLPVTRWSAREQKKFAAVQHEMKPKLHEINKTLKGAEKSDQIMATYKEFGVSPFTGLKGTFGFLLQLPILIALFAVTTESAIFRNAPFLWMSDLSLPDHSITLPTTIPIVGATLNLLPVVLGAVCILAAVSHTQAGGPGPATSPRSGLVLAIAFVIFFYPCAAALVLYWITVNTLQLLESSFSKIF